MCGREKERERRKKEEVFDVVCAAVAGFVGSLAREERCPRDFLQLTTPITDSLSCADVCVYVMFAVPKDVTFQMNSNIEFIAQVRSGVVCLRGKEEGKGEESRREREKDRDRE